MMRRLVVATLMFSMVLVGFPMTGGTQGATADQYYQYGNRLYAAKDYANAAKYYQAATQLNPNMATAFQALGNCLLLTNQKPEAVAAYEKALALNPNNPQLAAYVQNLKNQLGGAAPAAAGAATTQAATAAAPAQTVATAQTAATAVATTNPQGMQQLSQGAALFQQKQYAAAIPYFQQATQTMPTDYRPFYYLAYAQYMNRDFKNAAVNFYLANQKQPNATLKAYADRIKASLPAADQQWVDAQVAAANAKPAMAGPAKKARVPKFGVRAVLGVAMSGLKDFNSDADTQTSLATAKGYGLTGQVPKGNIFAGAEPFYRPIPALDLALGFGVYPVGKYSYTASGWTTFNDGTKINGGDNAIRNWSPVLNDEPYIPSQYPGDSADSVRNVMKLNTDEVSLTARGYVGGPKAKGFLGLGVGFYPASINWTRSVVSGLSDPTVDNSYNGTFNKSAIGEHVIVGGAFKLGNSVDVSPYVMYRMAKVTDFTGSITDKNGVATSGTLVVVTEDNGNKYIALDDGKPLPSNVVSKSNLEMDLSGIQAGIGISIFF